MAKNDLKKIFEEMFELQEKKLEDQENRFLLQEREFENKLQEQKENFEESKKRSKRQLEDNKVALVKLEELKKHSEELKLGMICDKFSMRRFSENKQKELDWKSPAMYTHTCGYKFCIGIDANGRGFDRGHNVMLHLYAMKGEYDDKLRWPLEAEFTLVLVNHLADGQNMKIAKRVTWGRPEYKNIYITCAGRISHAALENDKKTQFLKNDALYFHVISLVL